VSAHSNPTSTLDFVNQVRFSHVGLLCEFDFSDSLAGSDHVLVLDAHNTSTPVFPEFLVVVELLGEVLGKILEVFEVFLVHLSDGDAGGGLHVAKFAEVGLTADEAVSDLLFTAKGGQVDHGLNGINVVGHDDKLGLGLFNQGGDVVETELEVDGLVSLDSDGLLSLGLESQLLCLLGFRGVLSEHLEELGG
jgi:hypothetical protein